MSGNSWLGVAVVLTAGLLCLPPCQAADKGKKGQDKVDWSGSAEAVQASAQREDSPFGIFFCSEEVAKFAGEGGTAFADYKKNAKGKALQPSPFEHPTVMEAFKSSGMHLAKVPMTKDHVEVMRKFGVAADPTLVVCASTGEVMMRLGGADCSQTALTSLFKNAKDSYAAWRKAHPLKKDEPKKDEPKKDEPKKDEPKKDAPK